MLDKGELMSSREVQRLLVLRKAREQRLGQSWAAEQLGLSTRQIKRLYRRLREHGEQGLISRRRGRASGRRIADAERAHWLALVGEHYADFGPTLAHEYLVARHRFAYSVETLRSWMIGAGLWQARRRRAKLVHSPRARRPRLGELVQIDGSHHDWFEGRAAQCCLIAFIDDATGRVLAARFFAQETTQGYFAVLRLAVQRCGVPLALYSDRHAIFTKHDAEDDKPTQFERACLQLAIEPICANSPQAKGRVERLFQTLQDRLVKAMRLAGIHGMDQANDWLDQYLQGHNGRFAVDAQSQDDAHRPWTGTEQQLMDICSVHHRRQLSRQGACRFQGDVLQIEPGQQHAPQASAAIDIFEYADGSISLHWRGHRLRHRSYAVAAVKRRDACDDKTVNARVDKALSAQRSRLQRLRAEIAFEQEQRLRGIFTPDGYGRTRRAAGAARSGLRPARAAPK